jgi:hypothetical protein
MSNTILGMYMSSERVKGTTAVAEDSVQIRQILILKKWKPSTFTSFERPQKLQNTHKSPAEMRSRNYMEGKGKR